MKENEKKEHESKTTEKKEAMARKMKVAHTATKSDRKKDPYLSADSKVYK